MLQFLAVELLPSKGSAVVALVVRVQGSLVDHTPALDFGAG